MKILIVDDDALIRDGLRMILENEDNFEVVGTAANGREAVELCNITNPDIVVMDIRMPVMDGVEATQKIKQRFSGIKVLLLTTFKDLEFIRSAITHGAEGYILKTSSSESIIESIKAVYEGNVVFEKEIAGLISNLVGKEQKISWGDLNISPKEYEIMNLISNGLSNREISEKLFMSEGTIRNNISILLAKLGLRDRTQLAVFFIRKLEN